MANAPVGRVLNTAGALPAGPAELSPRGSGPPTRNPGFFWGMLDDKGKKKALEIVGKEAAKKFKMYYEAYKKATGLVEPPARERLERYRLRQPGVWEAMRTSLPRAYERLQADWRRLEMDAGKKA